MKDNEKRAQNQETAPSPSPLPPRPPTAEIDQVAERLKVQTIYG